MKGHSAVEMESSILDYFDKHEINISNCRGQSYDNASNMSGRYNGLQARIKEKNPLADYVPCFAHSLNLVGQPAVEKVSWAAKFVNLVDYVYTFFSASTHRWSVLLDALDGLPVVKQLSDTRWSAHADATKTLNRGNKLHKLFIPLIIFTITKYDNENISINYCCNKLLNVTFCYYPSLTRILR